MRNVKRVTHVEGSHCSGRVTRDQLYLHTEVAEQVRAFGLKASTFTQKKSNILYTRITSRLVYIYIYVYACEETNQCIYPNGAECLSLH